MRKVKTKRTKTTRRMTTNKLRFAAAVFLVCSALPLLSTGLLAQKPKAQDANTRSLQGIVFDKAEHPVEQAVVQLKNSRTLQVISFITQPDGAYHFANLKQDVEYQVKAVHEGLTSGWKRLSIFDTRKVAEMNLTVDKKAEEEGK